MKYTIALLAGDGFTRSNNEPLKFLMLLQKNSITKSFGLQLVLAPLMLLEFLIQMKHNMHESRRFYLEQRTKIR
jgi:hypothetical protein